MFREALKSSVYIIIFSFMFGCFVCERVPQQSAGDNEAIPTEEIGETSAQLLAFLSSRTTVTPTDLVIVLDGTQSVREQVFERYVKVFVRDFCSAFPLSSNLTRVAVILFASCQHVRTKINFISDNASLDDSDYSRCSLVESLEEVTFNGGPGSCLGKALVQAEEILISGRPGVER